MSKLVSIVKPYIIYSMLYKLNLLYIKKLKFYCRVVLSLS